MWFEWTQDDKLSKKFRDIENVPREKCINLLDGKVIVDVKTINVKMNVVDVNVAARSIITKE